MVGQPGAGGTFGSAPIGVERLEQAPLARDVTLNVNVPDIPYASLTGVRATRLGFRHKSESIIREKDPYGRTIYWVGPAGRGQDAGPGTDFHAIAENAAAVTPLKVDLTRHEALADLSRWLDGGRTRPGAAGQ